VVNKLYFWQTLQFALVLAFVYLCLRGCSGTWL